MSARPHVSVLVAAYQAADHLPAALTSVLAQTCPNLEVIVVDDASQDDTSRVAATYAARDPRVRLCRSPRNLGPAGARNLGLDLARGTWVALLDADDAFEPRRLEMLLAVARDEAPAPDMIADDLLMRDDQAGTATPMLGELLAGRRRVDAAAFLEGNLPVPGRPRISYGFLKPMFRRAFLERHGLRYDPSLRFAEDFDLYLRALLAGATFILTGTPGYRYTVRERSATALHTAEDLLRLRAVDRRLRRRPEVSASPRLQGALDRHLDSVDRRLLWRLFTDALKAGAWRKALRLPAARLRNARLIAEELWSALPRIAAKRWRRLSQTPGPNQSPHQAPSTS